MSSGTNREQRETRSVRPSGPSVDRSKETKTVEYIQKGINLGLDGLTTVVEELQAALAPIMELEQENLNAKESPEAEKLDFMAPLVGDMELQRRRLMSAVSSLNSILAKLRLG